MSIENDAPTQRFSLLRKLIPKVFQPTLRGLRKRLTQPTELSEPYRSVFPYTQVHLTRQKTLLEFAEKIDRDNIRGAVVECGVLDGGTAALMAFGTRSSGREVHLFDSWAGLPATSPEDGNAAMWTGEDVGSPRRVLSVMREVGINRARIHLHKGWFHETFPKVVIDRVALLHVDGDLYRSVRLTLETWLPKMAPGGFVQIDDYSAFIGCRRAVDQILATRPDLRLEQRCENHTQAFFIRIPL